MSCIEVFECNAEAIICGETFDVRLISGPNIDNLCYVDVPFEGDFIERLAIARENIFPRNEEAMMMLHVAAA